MRIGRLWLGDFRNHISSEISFDPRVTLITGENGQGKTNVLEAIGMLSGMKSFRGAANEAMVRSGQPSSVVRAEIDVDDRELLVELEINVAGRSRMQVNRQAVRRARDLADSVRVVVFSPDDLELIKGSPSIRRNLLDDVASSYDLGFRQERSELDKILRQRNALLKQSGGRRDAEIDATLAVWDAKLVLAADVVATGRIRLATELEPIVGDYYAALAGTAEPVQLRYDAPWIDVGLDVALEESRRDDLRRATTTVGPHRDELSVELNGLAARTHGSQGEQRSLALALRLGMHRVLHDRFGTPPIVMLDDVFSELDDGRARRLVDCLPEAQTLLTSATGTVPDGIEAGRHLRIAGGTVVLDSNVVLESNVVLDSSVVLDGGAAGADGAG